MCPQTLIWHQLSAACIHFLCEEANYLSDLHARIPKSDATRDEIIECCCGCSLPFSKLTAAPPDSEYIKINGCKRRSIVIRLSHIIAIGHPQSRSQLIC